MNSGLLALESAFREIISDADSSPQEPDSGPWEDERRLRTALLVQNQGRTDKEVLLSRQVRPLLQCDGNGSPSRTLHLMRYTALMNGEDVATSDKVGKTGYTGPESETRFIPADPIGFSGLRQSRHPNPPRDVFLPWMEEAKPVKAIFPEFYVRADEAILPHKVGLFEDEKRRELNDLWQMVDLSQPHPGWREMIGREDKGEVAWFMRLDYALPLVAVGQSVFKKSGSKECFEMLARAFRRIHKCAKIYVGSPVIRPVHPEIRHSRHLIQSDYADLIRKPVRLNRVFKERRSNDPFEVTCCEGPEDTALMDKHLSRQSMESIRDLSMKFD